MKKLLFILALGAFAACGSGETKEAAPDTTVKVIDTTVKVIDTTVKAPDTTVLKVVDSTKH